MPPPVRPRHSTPPRLPRALRTLVGLASTLPLLSGCATAGGSGASPNPGLQSASTTWDRLTFEVTLLPSGTGSLVVRGTVTDRAGAPRVAYVPACFPWIRLYDERGLAYDRDEDERCDGPDRSLDLAPSASESWRLSVPASHVDRTGPEPRTYRVELYVPPAHHPDAPPRAAREIPVGRVRLAAPRRRARRG